ncbi:hypothetical protein Tco_0651617 [Tanacetum coccineum]|uniref:Uncharacterized protein n=1 Tax=Tanacetum coccineum TaxID=301880 RepID=A0ABQ4WVA1_9ASTR
MNSSLSTAMVAAKVLTGEAKGDGIVRDAGETGKEPDDQSGSFADSRARRLASLYPKPKGSSTVVSSIRTAYCCWPLGAASSLFEPRPSSSDSSLSVLLSNIGSEVPRYLFHIGRVGDDAGEADEEGVS